MSAEDGGTTVIRQGSTVAGSVTGRGHVIVEGRFEGEVSIEASFTVAAGGSVKANVRALSISVAGSLVGNLSAKDRVEVLASGSVEGDIAAARLVISDGATLKGSVNINRAAPPAPAAPLPAAPLPSAPPAGGQQPKKS